MLKRRLFKPDFERGARVNISDWEVGNYDFPVQMGRSISLVASVFFRSLELDVKKKHRSKEQARNPAVCVIRAGTPGHLR